MKARKLISSLLVGLMSLSLLAGCNSKTDSSGTTNGGSDVSADAVANLIAEQKEQ